MARRIFRTGWLGLALGVAWSAVNAEAAVKNWDGGGADTNCTTAANWSPDGVPTQGDDVIFSGDTATYGANADKDCTMNCTFGSYDWAGTVTVQAGYAGTITQTKNFVFTTAGGTVSIAGGAWNVNGWTLTSCSGDFSLSGGTLYFGSGTLELGYATLGCAGTRAFSITAGTFNADTGTVKWSTFQGNATVDTGGVPFNNMTVATSGGYKLTLNSNVEVDGILTIASGGILDASSRTIYLDKIGTGASRPFVKTGTFTVGTSTVEYRGTSGTGTSVEVEPVSYYNLTINKPGFTFTFKDGATTAVSNTLTLAGASENLLLLRSTTDGTQWNLNATGTHSVNYVNVKDSNACGGNTIVPTNSVTSGNNSCWDITAAPVHRKGGVGVGYPPIQ